ncbi:helix-turn-helix domain-containing protein [Veillonella sp. YH-vei2232]|uniref:Helix-turn-helix domain-containing protein n=1 Tax=Veillonella absiana TaxID=3079305 RepID=A0ABU3Z9A6_9FIRM|nr:MULTISPECIES: helix-turn-helix domain-containing protein [unclassified Veillonella]MDV5064227.1 helix-turn-helix domain-containing protein [Veillonella sp. YH-vei2232]MDV5088496.1 helix-turn-helix domain-containing protein [Veillonella sp. YH-vei2233]
MRDSRFSINLKSLRKDYKLTQEDLGKILNVTKLQISYYERGVSYPKADLVARVAQYFNVPINQLIEPSIRSNFYFRPIVKGENIPLDNIPNKNGMAKFTGIPGLIEIPSIIQDRPYTAINPNIMKYANFMVLLPSESNDLVQFFYTHFKELPEQPIERLFGYEFWNQPPKNTPSYDGFTLLYKIFSATKQEAWLRSPLAQPANDANILALLLPENNHIIRLFIRPEKYGCKLHATYSSDLENLIASWLEEDPAQRIAKAQQYCLSIMKEETANEDFIDDNCTNTDDYDEKYNLKRFLEKRGAKITID